ncbi:MAG: hypothetical protein AAF830_10170 [Pseudomonadota bacterium]
MTDDEHLERHLAICRHLYESLRAEGRWPFSDSPNPEDLVDSDDPEK